MSAYGRAGAWEEVRLKLRKQRISLLLVAPDQLSPLRIAGMSSRLFASNSTLSIGTKIPMEFKDVSHYGNPCEKSEKSTCIGPFRGFYTISGESSQAKKKL